MAGTEHSAALGEVAPDLLPLVTRSGILTEQQLEDVRRKLQEGEYPADREPLAARLVQDGYLTAYQARKILEGHPDGMIVGRYLVLDRIGAGGMGRVYKARHLMMGRVVALKIISTKFSNNRDRVVRFRREMQIVGRLDHPNVVRAFDADQVGNILYIAMEYVPGRSLESLIAQRNRLPAADAVYFAYQAALGLQHAHDQGVVHRDVKPSNILLSESSTIKILDLGLGVFLDRSDESDFKTAAGITVGTIDYLSPEQACSREVDGRADIFSLGCVLYHMVSGRLPFSGDSSMERMAMRITGQSVPIAEVVPDLHPGVARVIQRMVEHLPGDRYQSCNEAAEALRALIRPKGSVQASSPSPAAVGVAGAVAAVPAPTSPGPAPRPASPQPAPTPAGRPSPPPKATTTAPGMPAGKPAPAPVSGPSRPMAGASAVRPSSSPDGPGRLPGRQTAPAPPAGRPTSRRRAMALVVPASGLVVAALALFLYRPWSDRTDQGTPLDLPSATASPSSPAVSPSAAPPPAAPAIGGPQMPDSVASGHDLAAEGRWEEAASAFEAVLKAVPGDFAILHRRAIALLQAGEVEQYRRSCEEALGIAAGTTNPGAVDLIRACSLSTGVEVDSSWAIPLVESTVESDPEAGWRRYILGLALYRSGQFNAAIARLKESLAVDPSWAASALNQPVLAMAYLRLGMPREAAECLDRARSWRGQAATPPAVGGPPAPAAPWWDRAEFDLLLREAEALQGGSPAATGG